MTDRPGDQAAEAGWQPVAAKPDRRRQLVLALVALLVVGLGLTLAVTLLPRWWAHRVGDVVDDSFAAGVLFGVVVGAVPTLLALVVAALAFRRGVTWRRRGLAAVGALVLASPNLTTLGIVLGRGSGARAGSRTLDVEATGFRGGTLAGAVIGLALFVGLRWLLSTRRRSRREVSRLRDELRSRDGAPPA